MVHKPQCRPPRRESDARKALRPARAIVATYVVAVVIGTVLLMIPVAKTGKGSADLLDAFFTAVSAICITGLAVVDTGTHWTPFGQGVILILMQIGGIGIMAFASLLGLSVMRRLGFKSRLSTAESAGQVSSGDLKRLLHGIVKTSLVIQAAIALVILIRLLIGYEMRFLSALWESVFHAIAAFNNAGFALYDDSLTRYVSDGWILIPVCIGVILGGVGYPVLLQLRKEWGKPLHWSMNTRIVLAFSGVLLVLGTVFVLAIEWFNDRTFGPLSGAGRVLAAFTHSTMTRSGGLNTVDTGELDSATLLASDILMFIGSGPAGTAGGIKVTTFAVLYFIIYTEIRGHRAVNVFGKRLSRAAHRQAITVALLAVATVMISTLILMITTNFILDDVLFEVISAFGTVGLSTGITSDLPAGGQLLLIALMFIGRLGPITLATALVFRERPPLYEYPKERPIIG